MTDKKSMHKKNVNKGSCPNCGNESFTFKVTIDLEKKCCVEVVCTKCAFVIGSSLSV